MTPLAAFLERVTYKEGWSFRLLEAGVGYTLEIRIRGAVNSHDPAGPLIVLTHRRPVAEHLLDSVDDRYRMDWLYRQILEVERHEAGEFFRVDGRAPFHPHRERVRT